MPRVSVVMPAYNSEKFIERAINSVLKQTYTDWELLIVNEYDSNDRTAEIVKAYELADSRIKLVQNESKLGLAASLNRGIDIAQGEYIARLDTDDYSHSERFAKQVAYMDQYQNVGVLGTWQHHFGNRDWIHAPSKYSDKCQAILLFDCNMCHSTVMIRKSVMKNNCIGYDSKSVIEDFKLWNELMVYTNITNIPEVLGGYYEGEQNISNKKISAINVESAKIVSKSLKRWFEVELDTNDEKYFSLFAPGLINCQPEEYYTKKNRLMSILKKIFNANKFVKFCNDAVMMHVLHYVWVRNHTGIIDFNEKIKTYDSVDDIFFIDKKYGGIANGGGYTSMLTKRLERLLSQIMISLLYALLASSVYSFGRYSLNSMGLEKLQ